MKIAAALLLTIALAGCSNRYPQGLIEQGSALGRLRISDGAPGATILVDGRSAGVRSAAPVDIFDVTPGRHSIEVNEMGRTIIRRDYVVGAGATIDLKVNQ